MTASVYHALMQRSVGKKIGKTTEKTEPTLQKNLGKEIYIYIQPGPI